MSDNDPDTNGGLPPKISLKPKTNVDKPAGVPAGETKTAGASADAAPALPRSPITLRKPVAPSAEVKPVTPAPEEPDQDAPSAPKRPVLRPVSPVPVTISKPAPLGIRKDAPDPLAAPGTKKSTSRITLPAATEKSTTGQIKTIRIAPRSQTTQLDGQEGVDESDTDKPAVVADPKRQTSRISLESVLGSSGPSAPATIKIKRPAAVTAEVAGEKAAVQPERGSDATAVDGDQPQSVEQPESQKKTLKVKRPAGPSNERPAVGSAAPMFTPPVASASPTESDPHWVFSIIAIAATLVAAVLVYVLAAQVTDPDLIEQPTPGSGLPWPARIAR